MEVLKSILKCYLGAFIVSTVGYLFFWFVELKQPPLNPFEWSEFCRAMLFIYCLIIIPFMGFLKGSKS